MHDKVFQRPNVHLTERARRTASRHRSAAKHPGADGLWKVRQVNNVHSHGPLSVEDDAVARDFSGPAIQGIRIRPKKARCASQRR
jgi:hypothetical protein